MLMQHQNWECCRPADNAQADGFTCPFGRIHEKSLPGAQELMWEKGVNSERLEKQMAERPNGRQDRQHCDERKLKPYLKQLLGLLPPYRLRC